MIPKYLFAQIFYEWILKNWPMESQVFMNRVRFNSSHRMGVLNILKSHKWFQILPLGWVWLTAPTAATPGRACAVWMVTLTSWMAKARSTKSSTYLPPLWTSQSPKLWCWAKILLCELTSIDNCVVYMYKQLIIVICSMLKACLHAKGLSSFFSTCSLSLKICTQ